MFLPWYTCILNYHTDTRVLLENTPLVKFIRNYIRDPSGVISIYSLVHEVCEDIDDGITRFLMVVCADSQGNVFCFLSI